MTLLACFEMVVVAGAMYVEYWVYGAGIRTPGSAVAATTKAHKTTNLNIVDCIVVRMND